MRRQFRVPLLVAVLSFGALARDASAQLALGPEFQVNTYTTLGQTLPTIATDSSGNFVLAWMSVGQDGDSGGIYARKHLASGVPLGASEFRVNSYTTGLQTAPRVASDPSGNLVVVWQGSDGNVEGVRGRRFDAAGLPGQEFQVNSFTTGYQDATGLAMDAAGDFIVAWESSDDHDGSQFGVFGQRYDASGAPLGGELQVNAYTTGTQYGPSVGMDGAGNFTVAWVSVSQDGSGLGLFARRYNAAGTPLGGDFQVNSNPAGDQYEPVLAMNKDGAFVVVWISYGPDGDQLGVFGRRYDASGTAQGPEFQVNQYTTGSQVVPGATMAADGSFVIAWRSPGEDGSGNGIFARAFTASGVPQGAEFQVNTFTTGSQDLPVLASQPGGRFVVSWTSLGQDGDSNGVFARRFAGDSMFEDGFESADFSKWSSAATDSGDLVPSVLAAMRSTGVGLQGVVDDTAALYVEDDTPADEDRYRARFYFATNGFDPGEAAGAHRTRIFIVFEEAPTRRLAAIVLRRANGAYAVEGRARLDDDTQADTGFFDITNGVHSVEIEWKRSSGPDANDGTFELWIDGVSRSTLSALDNSRSAVDFVRLGALSVKTGANGTLYWDEFESRRFSSIGP